MLNKKALTIVLTLAMVIGSSCITITTIWAGEEREIQHVILIVIDAVRPDVLLEANTPNLDALAAEGSYTWNAWTVVPSVTEKAIPSILTGATPEVHGSKGFEWMINAETLIDVFELAGLPCGLSGGQSMTYFGINATYETGYSPYPDADEVYTTLAIEMFTENRPFFMYVYNPVPDRMGHQYGPQSEEYRKSIEDADYHVGRLIQMLRDLDVYDRTLIVITPDHGMTYFPDQTPVGQHKNCLETDMRIWSIWRGPGVKENYEMVDNIHIPASDTYGETYVAHLIIDIAPTITAFVGLPSPRHAEGQVIHQIFEEKEKPRELPVGLIAVVVAVVAVAAILFSMRKKPIMEKLPKIRIFSHIT